MFRRVVPSIIRSSELYVQQQAYVRYCYLLARGNEMELEMELEPVQDCTYSNRCTSDRYCYLLASGNEMELGTGTGTSSNTDL
jgi:hypothetical protein